MHLLTAKRTIWNWKRLADEWLALFICTECHFSLWTLQADNRRTACYTRNWDSCTQEMILLWNKTWNYCLQFFCINWIHQKKKKFRAVLNIVNTFLDIRIIFPARDPCLLRKTQTQAISLTISVSISVSISVKHCVKHIQFLFITSSTLSLQSQFHCKKFFKFQIQLLLLAFPMLIYNLE